VYGEIPTTGYPICIDNFQFLYKPLLSQAGVKLPQTAQEICPVKSGTFFVDPRWFGMDFALWIHAPNLEHPRGKDQGLPGNTWVEVLHNAFGMDGDATWLYYKPGSGIWMNTGRTMVWKDHNHGSDWLIGKGKCKGQGPGDARRRGNTACWECVPQFPAMYAAAVQKGLDTFQFTDHPDMQCGKKDEGNRLIALEIVDVRGPGTASCGGPGGVGRFRGGWLAKAPCNCDLKQKTINCAGFGINSDGKR